MTDTSINPEFSEKHFRLLIENALRSGYRFCRFDLPDKMPDDDRRRFFMRHDVDISPKMAFDLGKIAADAGVVSNYFFQINCETYSFFVAETIDIIKSLRDMGHCVGLHVDERLIGDQEEQIVATLDWLSQCVTPLDRAVSFHRPSPAVLGKTYSSFVNAYDPRYFHKECYLSDSRRSIDFYPTLMAWLADGKQDIQLLLHPEWWHPVSSIEQFWTFLSERREDQLRRYMLGNFTKVFSKVLIDENRPPRI